MATLDTDDWLLELLLVLELEEALLALELLLEAVELLLDVTLELLLDPPPVLAPALELVEFEPPPPQAAMPNATNTTTHCAGVNFQFSFATTKPHAKRRQVFDLSYYRRRGATLLPISNGLNRFIRIRDCCER